MKNLLFIFAVATLLVSCNKFSSSNLVGVWRMTEFTVDGQNNMPSYTVTIDFKSDNTHITYGDGSPIYNGVYSVNQNDQKLTIDNVTYDVTNWQNNKMTLQVEIQGSIFIYKYEKE